ncbi:hypothetical protein Riv7116_1118 [Rivularia sp. PCC 7116]|nr:hypothetical protein Riv7116_1118 [Rivularia sp. PCC 7116]
MFVKNRDARDYCCARVIINFFVCILMTKNLPKIMMRYGIFKVIIINKNFRAETHPTIKK